MRELDVQEPGMTLGDSIVRFGFLEDPARGNVPAHYECDSAAIDEESERAGKTTFPRLYYGTASGILGCGSLSPPAAERDFGHSIDQWRINIMFTSAITSILVREKVILFVEPSDCAVMSQRPHRNANTALRARATSFGPQAQVLRMELSHPGSDACVMLRVCMRDTWSHAEVSTLPMPRPHSAPWTRRFPRARRASGPPT